MRALVLLATLSACVRAPPASEAPDPIEALGRAGISDPRLADLLVDAWRFTLTTSPELATSLGLPGYDHLVSDPSVRAADMVQIARQRFLDRAERIDPATLDARDRMFHALFVSRQASDLALRACRTETWALSPRSSALVDLFGLLDVQPIGDAAERAALLQRLDAWAGVLPDHMEALRMGKAEGRVATRASLERVITQARDQLAAPTAAWPIVARLQEAHASPEEVSALVDRIDAAVRPALLDWLSLVETELLPAGRSDEASGVGALPGGAACYAARIGSYVGPDQDADALHALGLAEIERIHAEFRALGPTTLGTGDLSEIFLRLREDPALRFTSEDEIAAVAEAALRRAEAVVPAAFGKLPRTPCEVRRIPDHEAPYTTVAYYRQPTADGAQPGAYFVNTWAPTTRPRHEAEVLAFHESVPGHHLQIALQYEQPAVPAFHRFEGSTAFVEGWALYTERLSDELGLYSTDTDRLGMLAFDAWRAGRLVVDTGLHHRGWSRAQAESWLAAATPLAPDNVRNEVDRYVSWPGQALAYKVGQLRILGLRAQAQERLGDRFRLADFHDVVLGEGAVSLDVLTARVEAWLDGVAPPDTPRR